MIFPITAALGIRGGGLPLSVVASGALVALGLALASGLPPAWQARRLPIVDALAGR
jgi:ABC-type lipoprotein release transport system permease subunit